MRVRPSRSIAAAISTLALGAGILVAAASAHAATVPPWEPDPQGVSGGTLTFYDSTGTVITSGSTAAAPFAAYAVGSKAIRADGTQAAIVFANPQSGVPTFNWYTEQAGLFAGNPLSSGPEPVKTLSATDPVAVGATDDQTIDGFRSDSAQSTATGYANMVQVRMVAANAVNQTAPAPYDVADIVVDPATHTWTQVYPAPAVVATAPGAPTGVTATRGNAAATVAWTAPAGNGGAPITGYHLQKSSTGGTSWTDVTHAGTSISQAVTGLTNGTSYVFRVSAINSAGAGAYSTASAAVVPVAPPAHTSRLDIAAPASVRYGTSATITARIFDTSSGTVALARQAIRLYHRSNKARPFGLIGTVTTDVNGRASAHYKPAQNDQFEWQYPGTTAHKTVTSRVVNIGVTATFTLATVNHRSIKTRHTVSVYGTVAPAINGQRIYLQQLVGRAYRNSGHTATVHRQKLPNGKTAYGYVLNVKLTKRSTYTFRMYVAATSIRGAGYSGPIRVKVS